MLEVKVGRKVLYKIDKVSQGMWIKQKEQEKVKPSKAGKKKAREMHERHGHVSHDTLRTFPKEKIRCEAYKQGKATKPSAPK